MFSSDDVRKQLSLLGYRDVPEEILGKFVDRLRSAQALHQAGNVHQQDNRDFEDGPSTHERPEPKLQPKQKKANKTPFVEVAPRAASKIAKSSDTENVRLHPNLGDDSFTQQDGDNQDARRQVQRQQLAIALAEKKRLLKQLQRNQPKTDEADQPEENSFSDQVGFINRAFCCLCDSHLISVSLYHDLLSIFMFIYRSVRLYTSCLLTCILLIVQCLLVFVSLHSFVSSNLF